MRRKSIIWWEIGFDLQGSLFVGLVLAAINVSISAQRLMELCVLRSGKDPLRISIAGAGDLQEPSGGQRGAVEVESEECRVGIFTTTLPTQQMLS